METQAPQLYTCLHPDEMNLAFNGTTFRPSEPRHRPRPWMCCFRDRRLWKLLFVVLLVLVLATLVLTIYTFIKLHHHITETSIIKLTPGVNKSLVTNKVSACDDFYHFACHKWAQENPKPKDWPFWDNFWKVKFQNNIKLSQIFENSKDLQFESEAEEKAKLFYFTCMDANQTIERLGKQPIFDLIDKFGGWNISSSKTVKFNSSTFTSVELQDTIQTMKKFAGVDSFFSTQVYLDNVYTKNNINYILMLYPLEKPLGYSPHNYLQYMIEIGMLLEADKDSLLQQMEAVFSFYKSLLQSVSLNPVPKAMMISELDNLVSFINWKEYFKEIAPASIKTLESNEVVVLSDIYFFGNLSKLVNDHLQGHNNRITLKNFLIWRAVESMAGYLPKAFEDARREQLRETSSIAVGRSPVYCAHITDTYFSFATTALFHRKVYHPNSTKLVKWMFHNLKKAFTKKLDYLTSLDQNDKQIMKNKADTMSLIGFPDFILDTNKLDEYYSNVNVRENALFTNVMEAEVRMYQRQFTLLGQNAKEASWPFHLSLTPLSTDAMYRKEVNQIVVPIGILQHPDLQPRQQILYNFGNLGCLLGHEFMHAFVNRELSSDENGWSQNIKKMFQEIHGCFSRQYSKCDSPEECATLNEDMADISGIKLAYSAFLDWQTKQQQPQIPSETFFLAFAQMWCTNGNNSHEKDHHHSTFIIRTNKPLSYMPEFAQEFNCRLGSKLNPQYRCNVF